MTIIQIPTKVAEEAIAFFEQGLQNPQPQECIGFFGMSEDSVIDWYPALNVSPTPAVASEVDATWLATLIMNRYVTPIAMAHSHPSGNEMPSRNQVGPDDFKMFPSMYVRVAFVWAATHPRSFTQYTAGGEIHIVQHDQMLVAF